ncbi:MAG TPA: carboxypeptidase regulatory-like domain-containing protein [Verrucomicrobiae bacterium]|nr:carboxypeptidase regulatory-like domain-containing protein [Verrucomicrobiae bacterium]
MKRISAFIIIAALIGSLQVASAGDVVGKITLKGTPPAEIPITPLKDDPTCGKTYTSMPTTHFYVVGADGGLGDVVVQLHGDNINDKSTGASAPTVLLDQKGCLYHPQIFAVQTGQKIEVENSDPVLHNVHVVPTVNGNPEENQAQMPGSTPLTFSFSKPEEFVKFKCDVHPWMFAWATVADNPYYAVSDKDGHFTIKNVPPGKYTITATHRKLSLVPGSNPAQYKGQAKEVEVTASGAKVNFTFEIK